VELLPKLIALPWLVSLGMVLVFLARVPVQECGGLEGASVPPLKGARLAGNDPERGC
jgi:hypothetical protein